MKYDPDYRERCGQPAQQQGRRIPPFIFESAFLMRIVLVSAFLPEVTQQIHSLRASGVISSQIFSTAGEALMTFFRSAGNACTVPVGIPFLSINSGMYGQRDNQHQVAYLGVFVTGHDFDFNFFFWIYLSSH